ncbi:MAG: hypothetical protein WCL16_12135, partial [bacterium]
MKQDFNKSNPHAHSAPFTVDPAYCVAKKLPESEGLSLCSESPPGACWLYLSGDIAAHLFNRMRREAFSVCKNVFHPGEFRNFRPTLYARRMLSLPALPGKAVVRFFCSGQATLKINGMTLFSLAFPARPEACEIDFLPYLKTGDNEIVLVVQSLGEPPALLAQGDFLETDARWVVSSDAVNWYRPDCMPCAGLERFPHQENLPELILTAKSMGDGLYDFGTETFGRPLVSVQGHGALTMHVGESVPEALATAVHAGEQFIPPLVRSGGTYACETNLALRYIHLVHPPDLRVEAVKLAAVLYPARYKGAFACSDDTLTDIWMRAAYTLRLCMRWLCVDGLKRDRLPWGGDLYMSGLVNNYSFHDKGLMQRSLMGLYGEGPETMDVNGIVDYSFFWVIALRDHHMHFGDTLFLDQLRPLLQRLLKSFAARCDSTGCIPTRKGEWVFIDW